MERQNYVTAAIPPDVDLAAVRAATAADLAAGESAVAVTRAQVALETARAAADRHRRDAEDLLARRRRAVDAILNSLDADQSARIAADDWRRATTAIESAATAAQHDQPIIAAEHYGIAAESLRRIRAQITE